MNDALKQAMIECLKIYVRTEMARSIAHPSQNKICANWSNGAFMSIQNKYTINMMDALKNDDYLESIRLKIYGVIVFIIIFVMAHLSFIIIVMNLGLIKRSIHLLSIHLQLKLLKM